jgi:O-antigen/teichoic acid export membrane protein
VQAIVLARIFGVDDYGRFALVTTAVLFVAQIIDVRVWEAATRFATAYHVRREDDRARAVLDLALVINLAGGLVASALVFAAGGWIAREVCHDASLREAVWIYGLIAPCLAVTAAASAVLRVTNEFRKLAILAVIAQIVRFAAAMIAIAAYDGVEPVVIALVIAEAVGTVIFLGASVTTMRRGLNVTMPFRRRVVLVTDERRAMLRFLGISNIHGSLRIANAQLDVVLLGILSTPAAAGTLKLATTFALPLGMIAKPFYETIYPALTRAFAAGRLDEIRTLVKHSTRVMASVAIPLAVVIGAVAPFLVPLIAGDSFHITTTLIPLLVAWTITTVYFWAHGAALAMDMQVVSLRALIVSLSLQMGLLIVLAPALGAPGAALCYLSHTVVWTWLLVPRVLRRTREAPAVAPVPDSEPPIPIT